MNGHGETSRSLSIKKLPLLTITVYRGSIGVEERENLAGFNEQDKLFSNATLILGSLHFPPDSLAGNVRG